MSMTLTELEEQARKLPPEERARLAEAMLARLSSSSARGTVAPWSV
jgi:hypothetical protein